MEGWATFPWFPPDWFKAVAGVGHSLAIWPQSWHLKHWRELGFLLLAVPSCLALVPWVFGPWLLLMVVSVPWPVGVLQFRAVCPRLPGHYWSWGNQVYPCLPIPSHDLSLWSCLGHWPGCCPPCPGQGSHQFGNLLPQFCGALPRVSGHSSLALTFPQISSFSLSVFGQQPLTANRKSQGCCRDT